MSTQETQSSPPNVWAFFQQLLAVEPIEASEHDAPWFEQGKLYAIDEKTYWYFLELLPPRWMQSNVFAFGEGAGPFRIFWHVQAAYFARELSDEETRTFCN